MNFRKKSQNVIKRCKENGMKKGGILSIMVAVGLMLGAVYLVGWGNVAIAVLAVLAIKQLM
ncbi:hypothetical protein CMI47_18105 [Candidatus Pacearchaeota archaeon]|jgi:hypothetical protein|nr:hypothetical protein [Candidatus Pacearchaeota archaeon]MDP7560528.1 hypothetical protein [Planctomycetota bacterium]|tara:strand:- start:272 stop:454 length:183 start_codon:yes stop_codon:yes gene_type:complete